MERRYENIRVQVAQIHDHRNMMLLGKFDREMCLGNCRHRGNNDIRQRFMLRFVVKPFGGLPLVQHSSDTYVFLVAAGMDQLQIQVLGKLYILILMIPEFLLIVIICRLPPRHLRPQLFQLIGQKPHPLKPGIVIISRQILAFIYQPNLQLIHHVSP